jgi:hypothetical protein
VFGSPMSTLLATSIIVGGPLGWLAWIRGYRRRAVWVWLTMPLGMGIPMGLLGMVATREPLVPWRCPACDALNRAERSHTVARATGFTLEPVGPAIGAIVIGGMAGSAALLLGAEHLLAADPTTSVWFVGFLIAAAAGAIGWGAVQVRRRRVPRALVIGYTCRACRTEWEVETDPDQGPNQAGAMVTNISDLDDRRVIDALLEFITRSTPYGLDDHIARWNALQAITRIDGIVASAALIELLDDPFLAEAAIGGLTRLRDTRALSALIGLLTDSTDRARDPTAPDAETATRVAVAAADALGRLGVPRAAAALSQVADDIRTPPAVAAAARHALERLHFVAAA